MAVGALGPLDAIRAKASDLEGEGVPLPTGAMRDARCAMRDARCAMRDVRCAMCDVRCAMCDVRCAMCEVSCAMYVRCEITVCEDRLRGRRYVVRY